MKKILVFLKQWTLLIAVATGAVGHSFFARFAPLSPWLLMAMLLFTFSNMSPRDLRFHPLHCVMLAVQIGGSLLAYALISPWNPVIAQCASLCLLTPTGTAAATITGMLGGSVGFIAAYTFIGSFTVVFAAPLIIPLIAPGHVDMPFLSSMLSVFSRVAPTMLVPLGLAWGMQRFTPALNAVVIRCSFLSYYLWALMIMILIGSTFDMLLAPGEKDYGTEAAVAATGILICAVQFAVGKGVGARYHRRIATGQALAQKNLMLAMWLAFQYLDPLTAVCLAAYSIFQNLFNATQIWLKGRSDERIRRRLHAYHERKHARMDGTGIPPRVPDGVPDMTESEENALDALPLRIAREVERGKSPSPPGAERSE